jgi:formylglycine-generating enzyme required for sulfatase activity
MKTNSAAVLVGVLVGCSSQPMQQAPQVDGMVHIPAGEFWRGCDPVAVEAWGGKCEDDPEAEIALDVPMRSIDLSEYWIDKYEATLGEYLACYDAGVCPGIGTVVPENIPEEDRDRLPINGLSWFEAETYCAWRGKRLPTEAEWEKAARGTDQRQLPWGDDRFTCELANLRAGEFDSSCDEPLQVLPVDAYPTDASPYGVIGMAGNVQEWVADWKGQLYYSTGPTTDPTGPAEAEAEFPLKILRGGYYDAGPPTVRVSLRRWSDPEDHLLGRSGVRCASSVPELDDPLASGI